MMSTHDNFSQTLNVFVKWRYGYEKIHQNLKKKVKIKNAAWPEYILTGLLRYLIRISQVVVMFFAKKFRL